jgi:hypothetical protein
VIAVHCNLVISAGDGVVHHDAAPNSIKACFSYDIACIFTLENAPTFATSCFHFGDTDKLG